MDQLKKITTTNLMAASLVHKQYIASPSVSFARESAPIPSKTKLQITNHKADD